MALAADVTTRAQLLQRTATLAGQLEVSEPSLTGLRDYAREHGMHTHLARLDALG